MSKTLKQQLVALLRADANIYTMETKVRVKLTYRGRSILMQDSMARDRTPPHIGKDYTFETDLFTLMRIFGEHLYPGCSIPFEGKEITFLDI